jgi:arylformamidase
MSRYIDVTMPISNGMLVWPSDPPVEITIFKSPTKGDRSTVSKFCMGTHTGTHIDAPKHFIPGAAGIETIRPEVLIGPCMVLDVRGRGHVTPELLRPAFEVRATRVLLRTGSTERQLADGFSPDFPALTAEGAQALVDYGVQLVGIDTMSIEIYHAAGAPAHRTLLAAGIAVIENLLLAAAPQGQYELIALPLLMTDADGAPARVLLKTLDG